MRSLYRFTDYLRHRMRSRTLPAAQAAGLRGEDLVHRYLRQRGYVVVARNFQPRGGRAEVDLIAWDRDCLVFVEVKSGDGAESSLESRVDAAKRDQIVRAAREGVRRTEVPWKQVRFDVVTVVHRNQPHLTHHRNAF